MMKDISFTVINDSGLEVKCDVLASISDDENKTYIIYTDYTFNQNNEYNVYVSQMIREGDGFTLERIENYELIPGLQKMYEDIVKRVSLEDN